MSNDDLAKAQWRSELTSRRAAAFQANPLAGLILSAWAPSRFFHAKTIVSGYWPFRTEIDPRPLMARFTRCGATLALPTVPHGRNDPLLFNHWSPSDPLTRSALGLFEPSSKVVLEPDIVLLPLLGFDRTGNRLGYGAGHYDRTLKDLRARKSILAVGLAFSVQEVGRIPTDRLDQPLDAILTERGFIEVC